MIEVILIAQAIHLAAPKMPEDRVARYASDIATTAATLPQGFALVATATVESEWDSRIETCRITGDQGRSVSLYQMQKHWWQGHSRSEVCSNNRLATQLAIDTIETLRARYGSFEAAMAAYVGAPQRDRRVVKRVRLFHQLTTTIQPAAASTVAAN